MHKKGTNTFNPDFKVFHNGHFPRVKFLNHILYLNREQMAVNFCQKSTDINTILLASGYKAYNFNKVLVITFKDNLCQSTWIKLKRFSFHTTQFCYMGKKTCKTINAKQKSPCLSVFFLVYQALSNCRYVFIQKCIFYNIKPKLKSNNYHRLTPVLVHFPQVVQER